MRDRTITPREMQIVLKLADGGEPKRIAYEMGITDKTLKTHIGNAMRRAGANTRAHLVALVLRGEVGIHDGRGRRG